MIRPQLFRTLATALALLLAAGAAMAQSQSRTSTGDTGAGDPGARSILNPSPDMPDWLRDRGGVVQGADQKSYKSLFILKDLSFGLVDPADGGRFVEVLDGGVKQASVRIDQKDGKLRRTFLLRARCSDNTFYFGPKPEGEVVLKPVEAGSVGELLYKELCRG